MHSEEPDSSSDVPPLRPGEFIDLFTHVEKNNAPFQPFGLGREKVETPA